MTTRQIQNLLDYLGYDPGPIDGANGPNTEDAVRAFQAAEGLAVDGIAGEQTQARLREAVFQGREYKPPDKVPEASQTTGTADASQYLRSDGCYHIPRGVNVQLTKNFWSGEIHCQGVGCCTESVISKRIMELAQAIRDDLGEPLGIGGSDGSGYRCKKHNAAVGGASKSLHLISDAVDLHYKDPAKLKTVVLRHLTDGEVGLYKWGCHVGRWDRGYVSQFYK
nr:MAG TPA: peptidase [Caudoviricetes sp.]